MTWLDRKIDDFIRRVRDAEPNPMKIGPPNDPTYYRYFVIPRNPWFNLYLHHFQHDDEENLHDHRMANVTFILQGEYFEERFEYLPCEGYPLPDTHRHLVMERTIKARLPWTPHRVVLLKDSGGRCRKVWSLFIGFPQIREWGFWVIGPCRSAKWINFKDYVSDPDPLSPGYGTRKPGL